jgi:hypothetical protein
MWWRKNLILDVHQSTIRKTLEDTLAHIIIQDANMGGNFWHFSSWYLNDPNRYSFMYNYQNWPFNKMLTEMEENEIVYLIDSPNVKFIVKNCEFSSSEQKKFCKILERLNE